MARYFFHLFDDEQTIDFEGMELPSTLAAYSQARNQARIIAGEFIKEHGHLLLGSRIEVTDESGRKIVTVYFSDVVTLD